MGSGIGLPFVAAEPKITSAVFGVAGGDILTQAAAWVTVPVEFLLQGEDEVVPRDSGRALFSAFAFRETTLQANPGRHAAVPAFGLRSSDRFFTRHLVGGSAPGLAG
jgi:hypothetical protein